MRNSSAAVALMSSRRHVQDLQLGGRFLRIGKMRRDQRSRIADLGQEQSDARMLGQLPVARAGAGGIEQLVHDPLVHVGILPQVDRREVEAEHAHGAAQSAQPSLRQVARSVCRRANRESSRDRRAARRRPRRRAHRRPHAAAPRPDRAPRRSPPGVHTCRRSPADTARPGADRSGQAIAPPIRATRPRSRPCGDRATDLRPAGAAHRGRTAARVRFAAAATRSGLRPSRTDCRRDRRRSSCRCGETARSRCRPTPHRRRRGDPRGRHRSAAARAEKCGRSRRGR